MVVPRCGGSERAGVAGFAVSCGEAVLEVSVLRLMGSVCAEVVGRRFPMVVLAVMMAFREG
jgi:hypothetical protein